MKLSLALLLLPSSAVPVLAQPWIPDPRCPGYNDSVRRHLRAPQTTPIPESDEPVRPPALRRDAQQEPQDEQLELDQQQQQLQLQRSLQNTYGDLPTFQLNLYWEEGFCWQSEWDERVYCMDCDTRTCNDGGILEIQYCSYARNGDDVRDQRLQWIPTARNATIGRLKAASADLCMERIQNKNYQLRRCDLNNVRQLLIGFSYTKPFELYPEYSTERCLNQQHDPRIFEVIELTDCSVARRVNTNRWRVIELDGDIPKAFLDLENDNIFGGGSGGGSGGGGPGGGLGSCFPSDATVVEESRGRIPLRDLEVGDSILGPGQKYSRVYAFGHKAPREEKVPYITLEVAGGSQVSLSAHHMIFLANGKAVAASKVQIGQELLLSSSSSSSLTSPVTRITTLTKAGAVAPFTVSGTFLVNDAFVVSSYVDVGVSHGAVHLVLPLYFSWRQQHSYDERGLNARLPSLETALAAVRLGKIAMALAAAAWWLVGRRRGGGPKKVSDVMQSQQTALDSVRE